MAGSNKTEQLAPGETLISFHYDGLDSLTGLGLPGAKEGRFYRNDELVNEIQGPASRTFVRAEGVVLAEHRTGGEATSRLLAGDDKNSVLYELSQGVAAGAAYSPYGHRMEDAMINSHLGYNGERREAHTGWYLLGKGYRAFNPLLMRFHSPDTLSPFGEGGLNAYMYCVGDPINHVDPTGHTPWGALLRGFRNIVGSQRVTTASPGYSELPEILTRNTKSHPTTLRPITKKHVSRLEKRALMFWDDAEKAGRRDSPHFSKLKSNAQLATDAYNYANKRVGKLGITKEGAATIKRVAEDYDYKMANRAANKKARVKAQQALEMQEMIRKGRRERDVRTRFLGYDPEGD